MTFKEYCRKNNYKVPLSEEMFYYYISLDFKCFVVHTTIENLYKHNTLNIKTHLDGFNRVLTFSELKRIIGTPSKLENILPWHKYEKIINNEL